MQAKLPDINSAIVRYRSEAIEALQKEHLESAMISLNSINALLPDDYQVKVSTDLYKKGMGEQAIIVCQYCTGECLLNSVQQYELLMDWKTQLLSDKNTQRMWNCEKCKRPNIFKNENIRLEKMMLPHFTGFIPEPPIKQRGIKGRNTYLSEFTVWFDIALAEIERKIGLLRAEYQGSEEEEMIPLMGDD